MKVFKGVSKNLDFFVRARRWRAENRSLHGVNEDSSTTPTPPWRKKTVFRGALKFISLLHCLAWVLLSPYVAADPVVEEKSWQETYSVSSSKPRLLIRNIWGDVTVSEGRAGQIVVKVDEVISAPNQTQFDRWQEIMRVNVEANADAVSMIVGDKVNRWHWREDDHCNHCRAIYQFEVVVPPDTEIDVSTVNGNVDIRGIYGVVNAASINGEVDIHTMRNCDSVKSINGKVTVSFAQAPSTNCNLSTINGDITLTLPGNTDLDVALMSRGNVYSEFEINPATLPAKIEKTNSQKRNVYRIKRAAGFRLGDGGPIFSVSSINGKLRINKGQ